MQDSHRQRPGGGGADRWGQELKRRRVNRIEYGTCNFCHSIHHVCPLLPPHPSSRQSRMRSSPGTAEPILQMPSARNPWLLAFSFWADPDPPSCSGQADTQRAAWRETPRKSAPWPCHQALSTVTHGGQAPSATWPVSGSQNVHCRCHQGAHGLQNNYESYRGKNTTFIH